MQKGKGKGKKKNLIFRLIRSKKISKLELVTRSTLIRMKRIRDKKLNICRDSEIGGCLNHHPYSMKGKEGLFCVAEHATHLSRRCNQWRFFFLLPYCQYFVIGVNIVL